jgi:hypothetical protein
MGSGNCRPSITGHQVYLETTHEHLTFKCVRSRPLRLQARVRTPHAVESDTVEFGGALALLEAVVLRRMKLHLFPLLANIKAVRRVDYV